MDEQNPQTDDTPVWHQRFRAPSTQFTQIATFAPDRGIVCNNNCGTEQWYAWDVNTGDLHQVTDTEGGHSCFVSLAPEGKWLYYLHDQNGDEVGHYVRIPFYGGEFRDITPNLPVYSSFCLNISRSGNRLGFIGADKSGFHVYCIDVNKDGDILSEPYEIYSSQSLVEAMSLSYDGSVAVIMSNEGAEFIQAKLIAIDVGTGKIVAELCESKENTLSVLMASPVADDYRFLAMTSRSGFESLLFWNPVSGEREDMVFDDIAGAVSAFDWSLDGRKLLLHSLHNAQQKLYVLDMTGQGQPHLLHTEGIHSSCYFSPDGNEITTIWEDATNPQQASVLDLSSGQIKRNLLEPDSPLPGQELKSINFTSSDGEIIHAWLGVPGSSGPYPTILFMHGGPAGVSLNSFAPDAQAWLDHGFAILSINYRGSVTFGRTFEQKIWGQPGHWELEDMVAATHWLVDNNIALEDSILLNGWSYGGYLTLLGLGKKPGLWAGGIAGIAIADWVMQYESSADTLRGYQKALFGGTPEEKLEQYQISSPITYVEDVRAPVMIIQGRNDTRTPAGPVEIYAERLQTIGNLVELHWFESGHLGPFGSIDLRIKNQSLMLEFAQQALVTAN